MSGAIHVVIYVAVLQWGALLAFCLPLHRKPGFARRVLGALGALLLVAPMERLPLFRTSSLMEAVVTLLLLLAQFIILGVLVYACVELEWPAALYCGIWATLISQTTAELWWILKSCFGLQEQRFIPLLGCLLTCAAVRYTLAYFMPDSGTYHIGPRQLTSAYVLGTMFSMMFAQLLNGQYTGAAASDLIRTILLCQFYCLSLLYLQTELFKKSALQKEMDALNLLYERQRQQYQVARQNVQIINRKCHELKVRVAELRRLMPEGVTPESLDEAESAARFYDAASNTGNEVLDVVLTEKALLCESRQIQLNSVADGGCLRQFEAGDLYALFANALDHMIASAVYVHEPGRRMIDLLVCVRQNFILINIIGPERPPEAAAGRAADYEVKVVRRIVQKYDGTQTLETNSGFAALKMIFPYRNKEK